MLVFSYDKPRLLRHFQKDRILFAYHIGDLDDFYFNNCQWAVDYNDRAKIEECILVYTGLNMPTVLAFGLSDRFEPLLNEMLPLLPPKFHAHYQESSISIFQSMYQDKKMGSHQKMKLVDFNPVHIDNNQAALVKLNHSHLEQLKDLYDIAYPDNYFQNRMLETGKYYAIESDDKLVSVAGIHVDSDEYKTAVLGNVATHPDYRGRGYATTLSSKIVEILLSEEKTVCLNVKADNHAAIKSYTRLGFEKVHEYQELIFSLK